MPLIIRYTPSNQNDRYRAYVGPGGVWLTLLSQALVFQTRAAAEAYYPLASGGSRCVVIVDYAQALLEEAGG